MGDDPRDIIKAAGAECRALDEYQPFRSGQSAMPDLTLDQVREAGQPASHPCESPLFTRYFWSPETRLVFRVDYRGMRTPVNFPPKKRWRHYPGCDCEHCK